MISLKKKYVRTDAWCGYEEPIDAVCGAKDTGTWEDSPCPTPLALAELAKAKKILKQHNIKFKSTWGQTSNVFCIHRYIVVAHENVEQAKELIKPLIDECRLLYIT